MRASGFSFQPLFGVRGKGTVMKYRRLLIAFAIAISLAVLGTVNPAMAAKQCDHQCLVDLMQKYVNALPKHDPTGLPFDKKIKFTENSDKTVDVLEVGKGMWENASVRPDGVSDLCRRSRGTGSRLPCGYERKR